MYISWKTFGINLKTTQTIVAIAIKNNETNEFANNDITGIISTGNTTYFTK